MKKYILIISLLSIFLGCTKPDNKEALKHETHDDESIEDLYAKVPPVSAVVNGVNINKDRVKIALNAEIAKSRMMGEIERPESRQFVKDVVDDLIREELIYQQRDNLKISITEAELKKELDSLMARFPSEEDFEKKIEEQHFDIDVIKAEIKRNMTIRKIIKSKTENAVSVKDADIRKYYDENKNRFKESAAVKASHILVKFERGNKEDEKRARDKIEGLLEKARIGADFSELAREYSDDEPSAKRGGNLGFFTKGKMIPAFEHAAFKLDIGEISEVVETPFGYHIIKVFDKRKGGLHSFDEVKEDIKRFLTKKQNTKILNDWVEALKRGAKIDNFLDDPHS